MSDFDSGGPIGAIRATSHVQAAGDGVEADGASGGKRKGSPMDRDASTAQCSGSVFDQMMQPRVAVNLSPYLDLLERCVIISILYHTRVADLVLSGPAELPNDAITACQVRVAKAHCLRSRRGCTPNVSLTLSRCAGRVLRRPSGPVLLPSLLQVRRVLPP